MEMNGLNIATMILLNTAVCILLPRIVTLNWVALLESMFDNSTKINSDKIKEA